MNGVLRPVDNLGHIGRTYILNTNAAFLFSFHIHETSLRIFFLSHNNPCFPCNIAMTSFLVSHTCEIRFDDVIDRTVRMFTS